MALPTTYLTSIKNLPGILEAIKKAQAPQRFTQKFLEGLGFASTSDRLAIGMLKALGLLNETGQPTQLYHQYLDETQSKKVLGNAIKTAYADLFQINKEAQKMSANEIKNKMKTLSQGQYSDAVLQKMATTFKELTRLADFSGKAAADEDQVNDTEADEAPEPANNSDVKQPSSENPRSHRSVDGLVYNINIHLPESRDPAVYDALFRSLNEHLL